MDLQNKKKGQSDAGATGKIVALIVVLALLIILLLWILQRQGYITNPIDVFDRMDFI